MRRVGTHVALLAVVLLAPVALYPDELVNHILVAAAYPDQVSEAARGTPAQPATARAWGRVKAPA